nr:corticosteroid binding globulin message 3'-hypothetical protein - human [Homo sapiens]
MFWRAGGFPQSPPSSSPSNQSCV